MLRYCRQVSSGFPALQNVFSYLVYQTHFLNIMAGNLLKPPESVRGQTVLNKEDFTKEIEIPIVTLSKSNLSHISYHIKKYFLKMENLKPVQNVSEDYVEIYLNPLSVTDFSSFPCEIQNSLKRQNVSEENMTLKRITLCYENFSIESVLRAVLPLDKEGSASFSKVGHIVHVNLREHLLPYKQVIGEVLFDKVSGCRTVVNKIQNIDNTYRNFQMEVLKGDDDMLTTVKESSSTFTFDFSNVYWNSRLSTEHERIVKRLSANDVLFDVFAGVGPFSIPAAKKKCYVYANDLNPESFKWLNYNAKANTVKEEYFQSCNKDGKEFIRDIIKTNLISHLEQNRNIYIVMNLPALAVEFLSCFVGLFQHNELPKFKDPPIIFVYCFAKGEDFVNIAKDLVINNFRFDVASFIMDVFRVRTVSSLKEMMRVTVKLDRSILEGTVEKRKLEETCELENKRQAIDVKYGEKQKIKQCIQSCRR